MTNRATLAQLRNMTGEQVNDLPFDQIALLLEEVADQKTDIARLNDLLHATLCHRFLDRAAAQRREAGKDTGTVTFEDGEFLVRADLPKKVEWDQAHLSNAVKQLSAWGENPAEYVTIEIKVAEAKFNAWPSTVRKVFDHARTVGAGKPTFKIERAKRGAA